MMCWLRASQDAPLLGHEVGDVDLVRVVLNLSLLSNEGAHRADIVQNLSGLRP